MAWTTPRTWVVGELVTASMMNTHVRDNLNYLYGNLSSGLIEAYPAIVSDVVSNASIADTISWTNTQAVADGDEIEVRCFVEMKNNKGSSGTILQTFVFGGISAANSASTSNNADSSTPGLWLLTYRFVRIGSDMYVSALGLMAVGGVPAAFNSVDEMAHATNSTKLTAPTFTAGQTGKLRITLSASNANFYWKTKSARVRHYR